MTTVRTPTTPPRFIDAARERAERFADVPGLGPNHRALITDVPRLAGLCSQALATLKAVEWHDDHNRIEPYCVHCNEPQSSGHGEWCQRAATIAALEATDMDAIDDGPERAPDGHINNCALANGDTEENCQMCVAKCPDRVRYP